MTPTRLTITDVRDLPFEDLIERCDAIIASYEAPEAELHDARMARIDRSLDELPDVYRWFIQLWSFCGHWKDAMKDQFGQGSNEFKLWRQREDAMERFARATNLRYEGTSRVLTKLQSEDPDRVPTTRR